MWEKHSLISFSKIGVFQLKAEPLAKKTDATKPWDRVRSRSLLFLKGLCRRFLSFASEDPPIGTALELGNPRAGGVD